MPTVGPKGGRPPYPVSVLLRIHFLQQWFALSDPAVEEALYDMPVFAEFVGLDLGVDTVPDETTILRFRHLLEEKNLSEQAYGCQRTLDRAGPDGRGGTVVDATLIAALKRRRTRHAAATPRCTRRRKAISGILCGFAASRALRGMRRSRRPAAASAGRGGAAVPATRKRARQASSGKTPLIRPWHPTFKQRGCPPLPEPPTLPRSPREDLASARCCAARCHRRLRGASCRRERSSRAPSLRASAAR